MDKFRKFDDEGGLTQDSDVRNFNFPLSKADNDLFNEDSYKPGDLLRVQRKNSKKNGECWIVFKNNTEVLTLKAVRFKVNEREFFRTPEGINFILKAFKEGHNNASKIKDLVDDYLSGNNIKK